MRPDGTIPVAGPLSLIVIIDMKLNKPTIIKLILLVFVAIFTVVNGPEQFEGEPPPFFIYPVIIFFTFIFSLGFFKGASTNEKLTVGKLNTFSLKILYDDPTPI